MRADSEKRRCGELALSELLGSSDTFQWGGLRNAVRDGERGFSSEVIVKGP